jgi:hypothetical protein
MLHDILRLAARVLAAVRPGRFDRDLEAELASHIALAEDDYVRSGMSRDDARRAAHLKLGGVTQLADAHRDIRGLRLADEFLADIRYGVRTLARNPGFGAIAIVILAIGIGANTAMFSVLHGVLLRPLAYPSPIAWFLSPAAAREVPIRDGCRCLAWRRLGRRSHRSQALAPIWRTGLRTSRSRDEENRKSCEALACPRTSSTSCRYDRSPAAASSRRRTAQAAIRSR